MNNYKNNLSERLLDFASEVIKLVISIEKNDIGRHIGNQVMRSATSSGANYEEQCRAESKADFIHKMQIVLKELRETLYWLKSMKKIKLLNGNEIIDRNIKEATELTNIIAKSIVTAKGIK